MTKYTKLFITLVLVISAFGASAQNGATTSSPYSRYGIGDIDPNWTPQTAGMGGIATATNTISGFATINTINPASYGAIALTTIDVGAFGSSLKLTRDGQGSEKSTNFRLNHLLFAFPVTKRSALSFGLQPYSQRGYEYTQTQSNLGTGDPADTNAVNLKYSGEGGLTKAHIGYGFGIGKHLMLGANVSYIFGSMKDYRVTSIPDLYGAFNTRIENNASVQGLNYDYGAQFMFNVSERNVVTFGYSGSAPTKLNIQNSTYVSHFTINSTDGSENLPLDSVVSTVSPKSKLKLPSVNRFGVSFKAGEKLLIGADYTMGKWSDLSAAGDGYENVNQNMKDSKTYNIGAQITPNINKLNNYWALVDYRFGFMYNQTNLRVNSTDITQYAATFGLGLPLRPSQTSTSYYKINVSAEIGKRGSLINNLVKENYINIRLGFTLNDKWFTRYKFD
ncbi:hypothetical protein LJ707_11440 [Mucilaginibacter sp. UR6-1]|uniref:hypothetical protein n=1 Tax=Mucilaginibacter sp. UR6-1 TaxID=1435643 RepID=UPI001E539F47|nr:hypothetical protein [Mucilaginibacter sp. UR6-1]MCC8409547.1 hypothetical protein [Mucilaginibacter sp. UR6-1]